MPGADSGSQGSKGFSLLSPSLDPCHRGEAKGENEALTPGDRAMLVMEREGFWVTFGSYVSSYINQETISLAFLRFGSSTRLSITSPLLALTSLIEFPFLAEYLRSLLVQIYSTMTLGSAGTDSYNGILVNVL